MAVVINGGSGKKKRKPQTSPDRLPIPPISPLPIPQISPDRLFPGPTGARQIPGPPVPQVQADPRRGRGFNRAVPPTLPGLPGLAARLGGGIQTALASIFGDSFSTTGFIAPGGIQPGQIRQILSERRTSGQLRPVSVTGVGVDPTPAPTITTPQSPFALEEQLFHDISQHVVKQIFEALETGNRNRLPRQITDVIAALLPWREWGFSSYQEALRELGFTELPGQGIWIRDEEITSPVGPAGQNIGGGQTATQLVIQRAGFGGGGSGGFRSPQFSTLINWRI